jgi:hypothetical protein
MLIRLFQQTTTSWGSAFAKLLREVLASLYAFIGRRGAARAESEQGLECGHRVPTPIIAKDKFIEVNLEMVPTHPMMRANKPLLQITNRAVCHRHDRLGAVAHRRSQRLRACHVLEPFFLQPVEALEAIRVYRGPRGQVLLQDPVQRDTFEIGDHRHAAAPGGPSPFLHGHQHQRRFSTPELATALQPRLSPPNPGLVDFHFSPQGVPRQIDHGPSQLVEHHPRGFVPSESKLALKKKRREPACIRGHQVGRPEPGRQRRFGVMKNRPGGQRDLTATARTLPAPLCRQLIGTSLPASRTHKPIRPATGGQILLTGLFRGKLQLKLSQRLWKGWAWHPSTLPLVLC